MKIIADINKVELRDFEPLISGAYRDKTINVELSPEYDGLSVWAIFDRQSVKVEGDRCYTPTLERGTCSVGIYAVRLNNEKEIDLRYSPAPALINIEQGSYNSSLNSATVPTESEAEQIYALIDEAIKSGMLKGDKGDPGAPGKDGAPGKNGYTPIKGVDYFDGAKGDKGEKGDKGDKGEKGEQGIQGIQGLPGADGKNATINGKNVINIVADDNISLEESGENIKISALNQKQIAANENEITDITEIVIDDVDNPLVIDNEVTNASTGIASSKAVYNFVQETENNMIKAPTVQGTAGQILGLDENLLPIWLDKENKNYIKLIDDLTIDNDITRIFSYTQFKDGSPLGNLSEIIIFTNAVKTDTIRKFGITFNDEYTSSAYQWNIFDWQYGFSETQSSGFFYCNLKNGINLSGGKQNSSSYTNYDMHIQNRIFTYEKGIEKLTFGLGWGHFLSGSNFKIYAR
jgi:hypothetical protein